MIDGIRTGSLIHDSLLYMRESLSMQPPSLDTVQAGICLATADARPDLDELMDRAQDVTILTDGWRGYAKPPIDLHRPHSRIEGFLAFHPQTARAISMLPSLRFVELAGQRITPEIQAALPDSLEELWADPLDLEALKRLPRLRFLQTVLRPGRSIDLKRIAELESLRHLDLDSTRPLSGVDALAALKQLEVLRITRIATIDFTRCAEWRSLREVSLGSSVDLDGIEALQNLDTVSLGGRRSFRLAPLSKLSRLAHLSVAPLAAPPDLETIALLTKLRSLSISIGSISSPFHLRSAAVFANLKRLEYLKCLTHLDDKDLRPLADLKNLKYVAFWGTFPQESVRWLQKQLPDCKIDLTVGGAVARPETLRLGQLAATLGDDGKWSVFEDLRLFLDCETNHDVEDAVKAHLQKTNPQLLKVVSFDSEADAFCVRATSRDDIESVAAAIEALMTRPRLAPK